MKESEPDHLSIAEIAGGWVALDTRIDRELKLEGIAREFVRRVQVSRKELGLAIEDRIELRYRIEDPQVGEAVETHREYISDELLAVSMVGSDNAERSTNGQSVQRYEIGEGAVEVTLQKAPS